MAMMETTSMCLWTRGMYKRARTLAERQLSKTPSFFFSSVSSVFSVPPCWVEGSGFRSYRGLGAEGLADGVVGLDVRPADQVDAVRDRGKDAVHDLPAVRVLQAFERLANGFRLAGEIDDQRLAADHAGLARQDRGRHEVQADLAHLFAETGHFAIRHRQGGFRGDVARRGSEAPGVEHEVATLLVAQFLQRMRDERLLVRDQAFDYAAGIADRPAEPLVQRRQD